MFVVLFEVEPRAERWEDYLATAGLLRPELERVDGFVDNERFRSERAAGRVLSLSTWRDEKALIRWRTQAEHYARGQRRGREEIFADYRLRVGQVTADTQPPAGLGLRELRLDETEVGAARAATIVEVAAEAGVVAEPGTGTAGLVEWEWFESIYQPGKRALLVSWVNAEAAASWAPGGAPGPRVRRVRIIRDYGMRERREAPQYFPEAP